MRKYMTRTQSVSVAKINIVLLKLSTQEVVQDTPTIQVLGNIGNMSDKEVSKVVASYYESAGNVKVLHHTIESYAIENATYRMPVEKFLELAEVVETIPEPEPEPETEG